MSTNAEKAFQYETEFLSGIESNFETAKGKQFRGSIWQRSTHDEGDRLRALLASNRIYDRERLKSLPANRRIALHGFERKLLFWKKRTGVAIASVLSPLSHYASSSEAARPMGLSDLVDHVRKLAGDARIPHLIGVCSPSGFSQDARDARFDTPNLTVVLIEPDGSGGWLVTPTTENASPEFLKIFDPETSRDKVDRVRTAVEERSADLLTGSLSLSAIKNKTGLEADVVKEGFRKIAEADPEIRLHEKDGEFLLYRGAATQQPEKKLMNVVDRIRQLFSSEGDEVEKINLLAERRAELSQRRDRIYEDIAKIEKKDAELIAEGKACTSAVPKRRLAAQLAQLRKDIGRQNATAAMLNKQIDIISTDIHNLTLIQQGEMAKLPDTLELTENAVKAEELLETLKADADLVGSLETGIEESLTSEDELAILREFEEETAPPAAKESATPSKTASASPPERAKPASQSEPQTPPVDEPDQPQREADAEPM